MSNDLETVRRIKYCSSVRLGPALEKNPTSALLSVRTSMSSNGTEELLHDALLLRRVHFVVFNFITRRVDVDGCFRYFRRVDKYLYVYR